MSRVTPQIVRTEWRFRLIPLLGWRPFPYIFHRYDVVTEQNDYGHVTSQWLGGFWRYRAAERFIQKVGPYWDAPNAVRLGTFHGLLPEWEDGEDVPGAQG